jgi:ANTAR domain-containing protein
MPPISVIEHSRRVRADSDRIVRAFTDTRHRVREGRRIALEMTTAAVDCKAPQHPLMAARLERLSQAIGRSPIIEQAKALLAEQYGISRGEAFELMTAISSHSNRKLRVVAEQLVEDQRRPEKAASSPR